MTTPLLRMVGTSAFATWLGTLYTGAGETVKVVRSRGIGEELPSQPDRLVIVARTGGPGLALEGIADVPSFQVRFRGAQRDPDDAETLADLGDRLILEAALPAMISGRHVYSITRVGSPPTEDRRDSAGRTHLTCNYLLYLTRY